MSAAGVWKEATAPDGRTYYYNSVTNATTWEKPADLGVPAGPTPASAWKVHTAPDGRNYYEDTINKKTQWETPDVLKNASNHAQNSRVNANANAQAPFANPFSNSDIPDHAHYRSQYGTGAYTNNLVNSTFVSSSPAGVKSDGMRDDGGYSRPERSMTDRMGMSDRFGASAQKEEQYASLQDAEAVFFKLLKRLNVESDWTWEQMVKEAVRDPGYRAIQDAKDRKAAFDKYIAQARTEEKEKEKDRQAKLGDEFVAMLKSHQEIKFYTRWSTARPMIEDEMVFKAAKHEDERIQLFNDFRAKQYKEHVEREEAEKKRSVAKLTELMPTLGMTPLTRWFEAQEIINSSEEFQHDKGLQKLPKLELLKVFESYQKQAEETLHLSRTEERALKARKERQNRDAFNTLLNELRTAGKIQANSKWSEVLPLFEEDTRYDAMLGQSGSTPMELFWDVVEEEDRELRHKRNIVYDVLEAERYEMTLETTFDDFTAVMQSDPRTSAYDTPTLTQIHDRILSKVAERAEKEKHKLERAHRHAIDDLRSRMKKLNPPVGLDDEWDDVKKRLEKYEEYQALETEELRKSAFEKYIRRLKEKEEDERAARASKDRDHRNGGGSSHGHKRHRTATPEADAYEADRRKAQTARERTYGKRGIPGVSPPRDRIRDWDSAGDRYEPRERGGDRDRDRDRERDRDSRRGDSRERERKVSRDHSNHYDRDRRDREAERERSYLSRADPKERTTVLEYGDEEGEVRPSTSTRRSRRDSDVESTRSSKRLKRYDRDTASPRETRDSAKKENAAAAAAIKEEDKGFHSGSEEGEIEED